MPHKRSLSAEQLAEEKAYQERVKQGIPKLVTVDEYGIHLNPHHGQIPVFDSTARIVAMVSGSQSGKTSLGAFLLRREIYGDEDYYGMGAGDYLAVTSTYDLFKLKMLPEMRYVFEDLLKIGRYRASERIIELADPEGNFWLDHGSKEWGRIILRAASSAGGLESSTAMAAWLDEAGQDRFTINAYEAILRRLSLSRGRIFMTTTPYSLGWLKQKIVDRAGRTIYVDKNDEGQITTEVKTGPDDSIEVVSFSSNVNPAFPQEEFDERRRSMPTWRFEMFYRGRFTRPAGMILQDFVNDYAERGGHLVRPFKIPSSWRREVGIDPGAVNLAAVWGAYDKDSDMWYIYREDKPGIKSTPEHASFFVGSAESYGGVQRWWVGSGSEVQQRLDFRAAGLYAREPYVTEVESGIDRIIMLLREHRIMFFDNLEGLLDQIGRYSRELDEMDEPTEKIKDKDAYHFVDSLRYLCVGITGKKRVLGYRPAPDFMQERG